jgi:lipoate---protein ligase
LSDRQLTDEPNGASTVHRRGSVADLHGLDPFAGGSLAAPLTRPAVWWCDSTDAAIVLGSRQQPTTVDAAACEARGLAVVRRRSGGGAVLIRPDAVVWLDLVLPHGVAPDDVRGAMVWAGQLWQNALQDIGALGDLDATVHAGGMVGSEWCDRVCFAGVGPGEVLAPDGKLVGLSQRRTRHGIRIQGMVHRRPLSDDAVAVMVGPCLPDLDAASLQRALAARLTATTRV